jgi:hypothetical protein
MRSFRRFAGRARQMLLRQVSKRLLLLLKKAVVGYPSSEAGGTMGWGAKAVGHLVTPFSRTRARLAPSVVLRRTVRSSQAWEAVSINSLSGWLTGAGMKRWAGPAVPFYRSGVTSASRRAVDRVLVSGQGCGPTEARVRPRLLGIAGIALRRPR